MSTLVSVLDAVADLLAPLVTAGTLKKVVDGPQDFEFEFPVAEVIFGPGSVGRNPEARILERRQTRTGVVRIYIARQQPLAGEYAKFAPIIDAVEAAFGASPRLGGVVDRFDCTGNTNLTWDDQQGLLSVDITWTAIDAEVDTYVNDW